DYLMTASPLIISTFSEPERVSRSPDGMVTKQPAGQKLTVAPASTTMSDWLLPSVTVKTWELLSLLVIVAAAAPPIIARLRPTTRIAVFIGLRRFCRRSWLKRTGRHVRPC